MISEDISELPVYYDKQENGIKVMSKSGVNTIIVSLANGASYLPIIDKGISEILLPIERMSEGVNILSVTDCKGKVKTIKIMN